MVLTTTRAGRLSAPIGLAGMLTLLLHQALAAEELPKLGADIAEAHRRGTSAIASSRE